MLRKPLAVLAATAFLLGAAGLTNGQLGTGTPNGAAALAAGRCGDTPAQGGDVSVFTMKSKHGHGHHMKGRWGRR